MRRAAAVFFALLVASFDLTWVLPPWWSDAPLAVGHAVRAQERRDAGVGDDGPRVWFAPAPASLDMQDLFDDSRVTGAGAWERARSRVHVFKFYAAHLFDEHGTVGPNTYPSLARIQAFLRLTRWKKEVAIEVPSVKAFSCDTAEAVADLSSTLVQRVQAGNAWVSWLALDEPFLSGQYDCHLADTRTATLVADFTHQVRARHPKVRIGLIEPYPTFRPAELETFLRLLVERGARPAFFHVDVDMDAVRRLNALPETAVDVTGDLRRLANVCRQLGLPYGFIIWGNRGEADRDYFDSAVDTGLTTLRQAFGSWSDLPDHLVFQSWIQTSSGHAITPSNLPERSSYTHTFLINFGLSCLRGVGPCELR